MILDDVRAALGYDQINIESASYGTRAALVYLRAHGSACPVGRAPQRFPTFVKQPLHFAEDAQAALDPRSRRASVTRMPYVLPELSPGVRDGLAPA